MKTNPKTLLIFIAATIANFMVMGNMVNQRGGWWWAAFGLTIVMWIAGMHAALVPDKDDNDETS